MASNDLITPELAAWIAAQPVFFVASAPLTAAGHINVSPRGLDTLRVLAPDRVVFLDLTGSGNETAAHLTENGRITLMLCAFSGPPRILRLYGHGRVVGPSDQEWPELRNKFAADLAGVRQIVSIDVTRAKTSCGFGVPLLDFRAQRDALQEWAQKKGEAGLAEYRATRNRESIDGLPAPR